MTFVEAVADFTILAGNSITVTGETHGLYYNLLTVTNESGTVLYTEGKTATSVGNAGVSFTVPFTQDWYDAYAGTQVNRVTFEIKTYEMLGGALFGTARNYAVGTLHSSIKPAISASSVTPINDNAWIDSVSPAIFVQGYSKIGWSVTATPGAGSAANLLRYDAEGPWIDTHNRALHYGESGIVTKAETGDVVLTVRDARQRTASVSHTITVLYYAHPSIGTIAIDRGTYSGGTWTPGEQAGTDIRVRFKPRCALVASGNRIDAVVKLDGVTKQTLSSVASGVEQTVYITSVSGASQHTVRIEVEDSVGETGSVNATVPPSVSIIDFYEDGSGMAFFDAAEPNLIKFGKAVKFAVQTSSFAASCTTSGNVSVDYAQAAKVGQICFLHLQFKTTAQAAAHANIGTITVPTAYRPLSATGNVTGAGYSSSGMPVTAQMSTAGAVTLKNSGSSAIASGQTMHISLMYMTED